MTTSEDVIDRIVVATYRARSLTGFRGFWNRLFHYSNAKKVRDRVREDLTLAHEWCDIILRPQLEGRFKSRGWSYKAQEECETLNKLRNELGSLYNRMWVQ